MDKNITNNELRLYTRAEAAAALSISKQSLSSLVNDGLIGFIMIKEQMYIPHSELLNFIRQNTVTYKNEKTEKESEFDLASIRRQSSDPTFNSINLLNQIKEQANGKYLQ